MPRPAAPLVILSVAAATGGCAWPSDVERFPAPEDRLEIVATLPTAGGTGVPRTSGIDLCLSDLADPGSLGDLDASLSSGSVIFDIDVDLQLFPWRAPGSLAPAGAPPWCAGSVLSIRPRAAMRGGTLYRVRLQPTLRGWAGEALDVATPGWIVNDDGEPVFDLEFTTEPGDDPATPPPEPAAPTLRDLFGEGGPFDPGRGLCSCHREPYGLARERLALVNPESAFAALVEDPTIASTGYRRVAPGRPSESFLIHKLLRDDEGGAIHGVRGSAMPLPGAISYADLVAIARWIEGGAAY